MKGILLFISLLTTLTIVAQTAESDSVASSSQQPKVSEAGSIALSVWIPDNIDGLTPAAKQNLQNRLMQIATQNGMAASASGSRFVLTANVVVINKQVLPGVPTKYSCEMDVTLYIGDGFEGKAYASYSSNVQGVGNSETRAFNNALQGIRVSGAEYQRFIAQGKQRIVDYFNTKCDVVVKEAQTFAATQQYGKALYALSSIPAECMDCWGKALDVMPEVFYRKIEAECGTLLLAATNVWNAGQNYNAAVQAGSILTGINPESSCYGEALALSQRIAERMKETDQREWDLRNRQLDRKAALQYAVINAFRDAAVAWGENQPQPPSTTIIYKSLW
jgi:hypothetical protein